MRGIMRRRDMGVHLRIHLPLPPRDALDRHEHMTTELLARTLWQEVGRDSVRAKEALACLVLNRALASALYDGCPWGRGIIGVCRSRSLVSCWRGDGGTAPWDAPEPDGEDAVWQSCLRIARRCVRGQLVDCIGFATCCHGVEREPPPWADGLKPVAQRAGRLFYRITVPGAASGAAPGAVKHVDDMGRMGREERKCA